MTKTQRDLIPVPDCQPEIGFMLAMLEDARERTMRVINEVDEDAIDWKSEHHRHTIGTLLYHIAAIEISWFGIDVMQGKVDPAIWEWFPHDVRNENGQLTIVKGETLERHVERFKTVRNLVINGFKAMNLVDFGRKREMEHYDVTPRWILHHLCQHEAEHRDELIALKDRYKQAHLEK